MRRAMEQRLASLSERRLTGHQWREWRRNSRVCDRQRIRLLTHRTEMRNEHGASMGG